MSNLYTLLIVGFIGAFVVFLSPFLLLGVCLFGIYKILLLMFKRRPKPVKIYKGWQVY